MIVEIYGSENVIRQCLIHFYELPKEFVPIYFSENEVGIDKENDKCSNLERFERFKSQNDLGFFLHSESSLINISFSGDTSSIFIEVKRKKAIPKIVDLLRVVARENIQYAFACDWEEWRYRNGLVKTIGKSTIENWVGRDYGRYLPGLYWCNLIPDSMFERLNINKEMIQSVAVKYECLDNDICFFMMFDDPGLWQNSAPEIDEICERNDGVFSKWTIWEHLEVINDQAQYFEECAKYP